MKRNLVRFIVLVCAVGTVVWLAYAKVSASATEEASDSGGGGERTALVTTQDVEPTTLYDTLVTVGTLEPVESITVRNERPGRVESINFREGERVGKGEQLLQMRNDVLQTELAVQKRRRDLLQMEADRQYEVIDAGGVSQHEYETTVGELEIAEAEIERIRARLDETVVRAPFDGVIGIRQVSPGAVLQTGEEIATLRKTDKLVLEFTVPERFADRIEKGSSLRFRTHGSSDIHSAEVTVVEPGLDGGNRTLRMQAAVDNPEGSFRAGAFAQVGLIVEEFDDVVAVAPSAIVQTAEGASIWVNDDGEAARRDIETGFRGTKRVQITDGLEMNEEVVVTGRDSLEPGLALDVDDSETAMDVDAIGPDSTTSGMRNQLFSETELEEALRGGTE